MHSCDYYQELISRLVDGEISREEHEALMAHLNTCSRCNAMYAVFHDLSDILSETPEPLPEGLHENIMAGVRRSEIIRKNRRLRAFGLRTALTAAACAVLVLFAASGFGPGKRGEEVSLRTQEAAEQLYQAPQAPVEENLPAPAENVFTLPVQTAAPTPVWYAAPAETPSAPAAPDAYLAAGNSVNETYDTLQPEQYYPYQNPAPAPVSEPEQYYEPFTVQTPAPAVVQTPAPAVTETPAPAATVEAPQLRKAESGLAASQDAAFAEEESSTGETAEYAAPFAMLSAAPAETEGKAASTDETEDRSEEISLFDGLDVEFASDGSLDAAADRAEQSDGEPTPDVTLMFMPEENGEANKGLTSGKAETAAEAQNVRIYGKEGRDRLFALLAGSKSELPAEAALTRIVHVTLRPEDAYGSEEKLDIHIYEDFVYYSLYPAEGPVENYRASCALKDLDDLLKLLTTPGAAASEPSPTPTVDPYVVKAPGA